MDLRQKDGQFPDDFRTCKIYSRQFLDIFDDIFRTLSFYRAVLEDNEHVLVVFKEHNHSPEASCMEVVKTLNRIKETASHTHDQPVQIIQDAVINMNQSSYPYMPNKPALRKQILNVRNKEMPHSHNTWKKLMSQLNCINY